MADKAKHVREKLRKAGIDIPVRAVLITSSGESLPILSSHGSQAIQLWTRLRELVPQTEHWPVLVGEEDGLAALREQVQTSYFGSTKDILDRATATDGARWFEQKHEELIDELLEFGGELYSALAEESLGGREEFRGLPRGLWPKESSPCPDFQIPFDVLKRTPLPVVNIALVPTMTCWHVPAFLRFGAWNECPGPEEHAAVMKLWHQCQGAEVVGITRDVVEMRVGKPPSKKVDALNLAKQQYLYCQDIVDQGTETLESLAAGLLNGTAWYFWWD